MIGAHITGARRTRGVSRAALAATTGLSASRIEAIERGETQASSLDLPRIATALNVRTERLLHGPLPTHDAEGRPFGPTSLAAVEWFDTYIADSLRMERLDDLGC